MEVEVRASVEEVVGHQNVAGHTTWHARGGSALVVVELDVAAGVAVGGAADVCPVEELVEAGVRLAELGDVDELVLGRVVTGVGRWTQGVELLSAHPLNLTGRVRGDELGPGGGLTVRLRADGEAVPVGVVDAEGGEVHRHVAIARLEVARAAGDHHPDGGWRERGCDRAAKGHQNECCRSKRACYARKSSFHTESFPLHVHVVNSRVRNLFPPSVQSNRGHTADSIPNDEGPSGRQCGRKKPVKPFLNYLSQLPRLKSRATTTSRQIAHSRDQRFDHGEFIRNGEQWHKCHYGQVLDIRFLTSEGPSKPGRGPP